ncbi:MAG TPA: PAS-domain containing protein, partial [Burkholderiaceae bacterium]|nr:PAS-domain containing protein [Burkholderiaceae bacterium]
MRELDQTIGAGLDQLSEGFAIFDEHLRLIHCNRPFHRVRDLPESLCRPGVTLAQLFKHNAERGDYGPGDAGSQVSERIDQISRREPRDVEMTLSSGRIVLARYRPLPDGGLVVTYEDISDLRRANAGLQRERERYELVTEAVSEGIYDWDVASDQLLVSDTLRTMFGFGVGQLTSRVWYACVHPDDAEPYRIAIRNLFKGDGERFQHEYRIRLPSGEYRWVLDRGLAIRGGDGRVRRLVGAVSDVTQAKIGESLLREARDRALAAQTMFE